MKFIVAFAVLFVCVAAYPGDREAQVLVQNQDIHPDGTFTHDLKIDNGIAQSAQGQLKQVPGAEQPSSSVTGEFVLFDAEGNPHVHKYIADENGYSVTGALVPQAP